MEIIRILAETFNFIVLHLCIFLHKFLHLNFNFVSFIIQILGDTKGIISEYALSVFNILGCYYQDFIIFLYEVIEITQFVKSTTFNILYKLFSRITYAISIFLDFVCVIQENATYLIICTQASILQVCGNIVYLAQLIFDSFLLILELGPNLLILLYRICNQSICYLIRFIHSTVVLLIANTFYASNKFSEAIFSIPVKAYLGALLLLFMFYQYKTVNIYLKAYFVLLFLFLVQLGRNITYITCICLKPITVMITSVIKTIKPLFSCNRNVSIIQEASSSHFNRERNSLFVQVNNFFLGCTQRIRNFVKKYLFRSAHAEEQIEQLQQELTAEREKHMCIICFDRPRSIILYPCRHMCICEECSSSWYTELQRCPLCRQTILDVFHVFT